MRFVVHMDTWNDLTKGIKGNTYIDWISHIEKIVKCVLPVTSTFATSALRPWLCKIYPYIKATGPTGKGIALSDTQAFLLAPQSGALRISAFRDFHPIPSHPIPNPLIAFEQLSLYTVF